MPRNSSGTYTLPLPPVVSGETIEADWANDTLADIAQAITDSLDRLGRGGMIGPFSVADGSATSPGLSFTNEPTSGIYRGGNGVFGISTLGVSRATFGTTGMNTNAVYVTDAITQNQQLATKGYVDAVAGSGGGGGGTGYLPLSGGVMTGNIRFTDVSNPLRFFFGGSDVGGLNAGANALQLVSGSKALDFSNAGILTAPVINSLGDITAANDVLARRWVGVGTEQGLLYTGVDATFGKYIALRSPSGGGAFTYFDSGEGAANILRGLNEIRCTGVITAYNVGIKIRSGIVLGAGRSFDILTGADGVLIFRDESSNNIMTLDQAGNLKVKGNVTPNTPTL